MASGMDGISKTAAKYTSITIPAMHNHKLSAELKMKKGPTMIRPMVVQNKLITNCNFLGTFLRRVGLTAADTMYGSTTKE